MNNQEYNISNNNYPITLNVLIEETINTVYYLENQSTFKQDISSLNKSSFTENGIIVIYEDYIRIENSLFTQNLTFNMIKELISEESNVWSILLENNDKIRLTVDNNASNLDYILSVIQYKINNQVTLLNTVSCNVRFNRNLLYLLGDLAKCAESIRKDVMIRQFVNLYVFDTHLMINNNNLELILPYNRLKDLKQSNNTLELIFHDDANIFLEEMPYSDATEIAEFVIRKIINPPAYNANNNSAMTPSTQFNNSLSQTQSVVTQQQSYNQYTQDNYYHPPRNQKSKIIGLLLNMLVVGLGYAYVGKWGEAIILFITYCILIFFGILLSIILIGLVFIIIALILWIYTLFKTNEMIDKYNRGEPY